MVTHPDTRVCIDVPQQRWSCCTRGKIRSSFLSVSSGHHGEEGGRLAQQPKPVPLLTCRFGLTSFQIFFLIVHFLLDPLLLMLELFMDSISSNGQFST